MGVGDWLGGVIHKSSIIKPKDSRLKIETQRPPPFGTSGTPRGVFFLSELKVPRVGLSLSFRKSRTNHFSDGIKRSEHHWYLSSVIPSFDELLIVMRILLALGQLYWSLVYLSGLRRWVHSEGA